MITFRNVKEGAGSKHVTVVNRCTRFPGKQDVEQFLRHFEGEELFVKVGMELFYKEGPAIITYLKEKGHKIFLDLKLHDIPNTVKSAMRSLASLDVDMVNVHAGGEAV